MRSRFAARAAFLPIAALALTAPAYAQSDARIAVGADVSHRSFASEGLHRGVKVGFLYRIRSQKHEDGWSFRAPQFGLNWFGADVTMAVGGQDTSIGSLRIRPILVGVAEALVLNGGRDELSFSLLTGPAFAEFDVSAEARRAFRQRLAADPVAIDAKNTWVLRPGISYWHDLGPRFGFHAGFHYVIARPHVVMRTPTRETRSRWHADSAVFKTGLVFKVF